MLDAGKQWSNILRDLRENTVGPQSPYPGKLSPRYWDPVKAFVRFARTQFPTHDPYFRELPEGCCPGKFKGETEALIKGEKHSRKCFRPVVWNLSSCLLLTALTPVDAGKGGCPEVRSPGCSAVRRGCPHTARSPVSAHLWDAHLPPPLPILSYPPVLGTQWSPFSTPRSFH